jgi:hypothetical protein
LLNRLSNRGNRQTGLLAQRWDDSTFLFQQRQKKVLDVNPLMTPPHGMRRGRLERFLELDGHPVHVHAHNPFLSQVADWY